MAKFDVVVVDVGIPHQANPDDVEG